MSERSVLFACLIGVGIGLALVLFGAAIKLLVLFEVIR